MHHQQWFIKLIPFVFVLLWSTGFIGAKYTLPYIEPFYLLFIRMLMTVAAFITLMWWFKAPRLTRAQTFHQCVSGLLLHGAYLGGVFAAIKWQMPAGLTALIVSMQPLLTAVLLFRRDKQSLTLMQCCGLLIGFSGVVVVLYSKGVDGSMTFSLPMVLAALGALIGITLGTLYQKRFAGDVNLLSASVVQYSATALLMALLTYTTESQMIDWQWPFVAGMLWLVFGLSVSAMLLLLFMIKQGEATKVASYFYLVPGVTVIQAWWLFDEKLASLAIMGLILSVVGVYLTTVDPARR